MLKQKEDVLLMAKHVRYKKVDGTLYVNSGRVAWRNQTSDSFRISAKFEDIRLQRISPDQKEKVQLQLLMHSGESFTFQFSDPGGREKQLEMRNNVKTMLQNLLPKFKDKAQAELKEKFRLLESNPEILALYKELVVSGILSSEEFWARPEFSHSSNSSSKCSSNVKTNSKVPPAATTTASETVGSNTSEVSNTIPSNGPTSQISRSFHLDERPQVVGVPSCLLSDIKPEADGANGIKYNLTHDTIDAIFRAYPSVREKHRETVPDKLSEAEFWIKFFQSHYFHRDRVHMPKDDIFADCAKMDDRLLMSDIRRTRVNKNNVHLDLLNLTDYDIGQGYGTDQISSQSKTKVIDPTSSNGNAENTITEPTPCKLSANQLLLRRFNNHSILVLKSLGSNETSQGSKDILNSCPLKDSVYVKELVEDQNPPEIQLDLTCVSDYLEGPTSSKAEKATKLVDPLLAPRQTDTSVSRVQLIKALNKCKNSLLEAYQAPKRPRSSLLTAVESQQALADVSPGGCLIGGKLSSGRSKANALTGDQSLHLFEHELSSRMSNSQRACDEHHAGDSVDRGPPLLSSEQVRELSLLYSSAAELLRHFWACFPVTTPQLAEKLDRVAASLVRFRTTKVVHFAASVDPSFRSNMDDPSEELSNRRDPSVISYRSSVTSHLESMLDVAQNKYSDWKNRHQ
uniref:BSD domain-containing protein n=1 Tax=Trichobilharzia regenti TaxID=157069 RepID=A0AA85K819_TRIRE|nr:unnamed protein product [Trichobilharzia regenti]